VAVMVFSGGGCRERYAYLPYLYTLFRHAHTEGAPIMRPMWYEFPTLEAGFATDDQFLVGPGLLVAPVLQAGATSRTVLLPPSSRWFDAHTGAEMKPGHVRPLPRAPMSIFYIHQILAIFHCSS
jgi:alpha-glucosidase (family GH31 glycosyl hydrolase)